MNTQSPRSVRLSALLLASTAWMPFTGCQSEPTPAADAATIDHPTTDQPSSADVDVLAQDTAAPDVAPTADASDVAPPPDVPALTDVPAQRDAADVPVAPDVPGVTCTAASPVGPGVTGLTVEGCSFERGSVGVASDNELRALTLEPGGNTLYLAYGASGHVVVERFVDDAAVGCQLHRDDAWRSPLPAGEDALYLDVAADGTVFVGSPNVVAWTTGRTGTCASTTAGFGARASMQVGSDDRIVAADGAGPARLLTVAGCGYANAAFGPAVALGAGRVGGDFVFVSAAQHVERYDSAGAVRWVGAATLSAGGEVRPCGADVCVLEAGTSPGIAKISGIDGSRVATHTAAQLFGASYSGATRMDACPGGSTLAVAWTTTPDPACGTANRLGRAVALVRMRGW